RSVPGETRARLTGTTRARHRQFNHEQAPGTGESPILTFVSWTEVESCRLAAGTLAVIGSSGLVVFGVTRVTTVTVPVPESDSSDRRDRVVVAAVAVSAELAGFDHAPRGLPRVVLGHTHRHRDRLWGHRAMLADTFENAPPRVSQVDLSGGRVEHRPQPVFGVERERIFGLVHVTARKFQFGLFR